MNDRLPAIPPPPPPVTAPLPSSPAKASHLSAALSAVADLLPSIVEMTNPQMVMRTQKGSAHLVRQLGSTAKLAGNTGAVQSTQTGKFIGQLRFDQVQSAGKLAAGSTMVFQLAGAAAMQQALDQIADSLQRVEGKVDRVLWNQQQEVIDHAEAQEDLLAQVITVVHAGREPDAALVARLRDIEAALTPTVKVLVSQVEKDLESIGGLGEGLSKLVARANDVPTVETSGSRRLDRMKTAAKLSAQVTADFAARSVSTVRSGDLRKELAEASDSITRTEQLLVVALRAISTRAMAGLLASHFDDAQPPAAHAAEVSAIRNWISDHRERLAAATNLTWVHDVDQQVLSRLFVGQSKDERRVGALSPRLVALDTNVDTAIDALGLLGRTDVIDFELVEAGGSLPPPPPAR